MPPQSPEANKKEGVSYAYTEDGLELPIVDITHDAFAIDIESAQLAALAEAAKSERKMAAKIPTEVQHNAAARSIIMRGIIAAAGGVLGGITTYLLKLGPDNLGNGYAGPIDRQLAGGFNAVTMRMRLQETAQLLASGLLSLVEETNDRPIHLVNLGGGTAPDSINALIVLQQTCDTGLLHHSRVMLHVFDIDTAAATFGSRALNALSEVGAPLEHVRAVFNHVNYDWNNAEYLSKHLSEFRVSDGTVAVSTEGGLFEYGSDKAIQENLYALRENTPGDAFVVGSVIRDDDLTRELLTTTSITIRMMELEAFSSLVDAAGWKVERVMRDNPLYYVVRLRKR